MNDSEVLIEKYETGAERQQREQLARIEEERIIAEMGDRWRERGLDMMMSGKLEIDTEDELFKVSIIVVVLCLFVVRKRTKV